MDLDNNFEEGLASSQEFLGDAPDATSWKDHSHEDLDEDVPSIGILFGDTSNGAIHLTASFFRRKILLSIQEHLYLFSFFFCFS